VDQHSTTRLQGKKALVTAAGQGIGRATVEAFAAEGAKVFATDISEKSLSEFDALDGVTTFILDVTESSEVSSVLGQIGPLDVLFNCAGFVDSGTVLDCNEDAWDYSFDLNVKAMYRVIRTALPAMLDNGGGSILNMSSVASSIKGVPNRFAYCASKAAVVGLTKAVAADYVTQSIRCNAICPGTIDSPSLHEGRIGKAEEVAALAVYLASDESRFTTGQTHIVDGGWAI